MLVEGQFFSMFFVCVFVNALNDAERLDACVCITVKPQKIHCCEKLVASLDLFASTFLAPASVLVKTGGSWNMATEKEFFHVIGIAQREKNKLCP